MDRHEEHLPQGVDDGHHAHIQVPAIALEGGVAHDLHQTVGHVHKKAGQTQSHDALYPPGLQRQTAELQGEQGPPPGEEFQHPGRRDALGDDGGQGRPSHPHVQQEDEDGVQHDVHRRPQHHRHHAHRTKALGVDKGVHPQADHHEQGAHEIDGHVVVGIGKGGIAGPEEIEDGPLKNQKEGGADRPQDEQQGEGVAHHPLGLLPVPLAPADREDGPAPGAAQVGKAHDDGHDGDGHA